MVMLFKLTISPIAALAAYPLAVFALDASERAAH